MNKIGDSVLNVSVVLPRNCHFSIHRPTAVDLSASDFVRFSRYRGTTTIHTHPTVDPFEDFNVRYVPRSKFHGQVGRAFARSVLETQADIVIVHQHVPTAFALSRALSARQIPVVLHRHAWAKHPQTRLGRWRERVRYSHFARIIWVSDAIASPFIDRHPALESRIEVIPNGLDLSLWTPQQEREREILFVGRAHPEKGGLPAAHGVRKAIIDRPDWRTRFILNRTSSKGAQTAEIMKALQPLENRAKIEIDVPYEDVRNAFERAAIALVPSVYREPFGRTALEAMAGGAALIHSGRGGLSGDVGNAGITLDAITPDEISASIYNLIHEPNMLEKLSYLGVERAKMFDIRRIGSSRDSILIRLVEETEQKVIA